MSSFLAVIFFVVAMALMVAQKYPEAGVCLLAALFWQKEREMEKTDNFRKEYRKMRVETAAHLGSVDW
jgi:hypothetical protein